IVLAVALWFRISEKSEQLPAIAQVVQIAPKTEKIATIPQEPASLRAGSRVPVEGGTLSIETDATIALGANSVRLIEGTIQLDVGGAEDRVFVVETPKADIRVTDGALQVIAGRDELRVDVSRGTVDVRAREGTAKAQRVRAGES